MIFSCDLNCGNYSILILLHGLKQLHAAVIIKSIGMREFLQSVLDNYLFFVITYQFNYHLSKNDK